MRGHQQHANLNLLRGRSQHQHNSRARLCKSMFKGRIYEEVSKELERLSMQVVLPALPRSMKAEKGFHKPKTEFRPEKGLQRGNLLAEMKGKDYSQKCLYRDS